MLSSHWRFLLLHPHMLFVGVSPCQPLLPQLLFANRLLLLFFFFCLCCPCLFVDIHGVCLLRMFFVVCSVSAGCPPPPHPLPPVARIQATAACRSSGGAKDRWRRRMTRASLMKESTTMTPTHSPPTCEHKHGGEDIYPSVLKHLWTPLFILIRLVYHDETCKQLTPMEEGEAEEERRGGAWQSPRRVFLCPTSLGELE